MKNELSLQQIKSHIFLIRNVQVMLDRDLADLYQVETKVLNQAVKRNIERFPDTFRFQLNDEDKNQLVTNCDRFKTLKHSSVNPYAFTEQGVAMLSAVLKSDVAVEISIQIMQAFVEMRRFILKNDLLDERLERVETRLITHISHTDDRFNQIFNAMNKKDKQPEQGIFYDGQIFDAYTFVAFLIKKAKKSIILIDNYVDESVLLLLTKRGKSVKSHIYTKKITKQLELDIKKHNEQYPAIKITIFPDSHDRFLIIDSKELYHLGASLKDLGKKWFAFLGWIL